MSEIGSQIDRLVKEHLAPPLRAAGFRGSGRSFCRSAGEAIQVVNVQSSKWNQGSEGKFTINLGVFFSTIARLVDPERVPVSPKEYECTVRARIGKALGSAQDLWWEVDSSTQTQVLGAQVSDLLMSAGLAWLDRNSQLDAALEELRHQPVPLAAALISLGRTGEAASVIESAVAGGGPAEAYQRRWGMKHGLLAH